MTKPCVGVHLQWKEPARHRPSWADKGTNPRTGRAQLGCQLVRQRRATNPRTGGQRPKDRQPLLRLNLKPVAAHVQTYLILWYAVDTTELFMVSGVGRSCGYDVVCWVLFPLLSRCLWSPCRVPVGFFPAVTLRLRVTLNRFISWCILDGIVSTSLGVLVSCCTPPVVELATYFIILLDATYEWHFVCDHENMRFISLCIFDGDVSVLMRPCVPGSCCTPVVVLAMFCGNTSL